MIVSSNPGVYVIYDYNTTRFFIGYSTKDMYERVRNHMWRIEEGCHEYKELNQAFAHKHDLEYASLIDFPVGISPARVREKRNQIVSGLQTYMPDCGFNGKLNRSNHVEHFDVGLYVITVRDKKTKLRKFYIGQSNEIHKRLEQHKYSLSCGIHGNTALQDDFNTKEQYEFQFMRLITFRNNEITQAQLNSLEVNFIYCLRSYLSQYGYNKNARGICIHRN